MKRRRQPQIVLFDTPRRRGDEIVHRLDQRGVAAERFDIHELAACPIGRKTRAVVVAADDSASSSDDALKELFDQLRQAQIPTLLWGDVAPAASPGAEIQTLPADLGADEIVGRLTVLAHYVPLVKQLDSELQHLQRLAAQMNRYFEEVEREMQLASRLQRDFLPRELPSADRIRFAQMYRPAAWVSGDIFDIFRLDNRRVALFLADAMGHGTAAALVTMFVRKSLVTSVWENDTQRILEPVQALAHLHDEFARQDLPNAQFVTAVYAIIDTESATCTLARGGHPYPILVRPDGSLDELRTEGGLLGIAGIEPEFEQREFQLNPGERLLFYTDGIESILTSARTEDGKSAVFTDELKSWAAEPGGDLIASIRAYLDRQEGSLNQEDDQTVLTLEVRA
ncbi:MAG: hypothetical protein D6744_08185 [Planctomycetota bacterium]|nr:MAG: hypothetical protein D6744_08185 [Planctomycetota bacterium]